MFGPIGGHSLSSVSAHGMEHDGRTLYVFGWTILNICSLSSDILAGATVGGLAYQATRAEHTIAMGYASAAIHSRSERVTMAADRTVQG